MDTSTLAASKRRRQESISDLVSAEGSFIFCDSRMVAEKFGVNHRNVTRTVEYVLGKMERINPVIKTILPEFKKHQFEYRGKFFKYYAMNKSGFILVAMRFETDKAFEWQLKFVDAFEKLENEYNRLKILKQNTEWLEARKAGKPIRKIETDVVKRFVEYAIGQGSTNAKMYYTSISKMENKALFFIEQKYKNIRDILSIHQLGIIGCADTIVANALEDGIKQRLPYQKIYLLAKDRIESFAEMHGKTLVPAVERIKVPAIENSNQLRLAGCEVAP